MKTQIKIALALCFTTLLCQIVMAQPPGPPAPSGVPFDGGLVAFLVVSLLGGARYLYKK